MWLPDGQRAQVACLHGNRAADAERLRIGASGAATPQQRARNSPAAIGPVRRAVKRLDDVVSLNVRNGTALHQWRI